MIIEWEGQDYRLSLWYPNLGYAIIGWGTSDSIPRISPIWQRFVKTSGHRDGVNHSEIMIGCILLGPTCCLMFVWYFVLSFCVLLLPSQAFYVEIPETTITRRRRSIWRARGTWAGTWNFSGTVRCLQSGITGMDCRFSSALSWGLKDLVLNMKWLMIGKSGLYLIASCKHGTRTIFCQSVFIYFIYLGVEFACLCTQQVDDEEAIPVAKSRPLAAMAVAMEMWKFVSLKKYKKGRPWSLTSMGCLVRCPWFQIMSPKNMLFWCLCEPKIDHDSAVLTPWDLALRCQTSWKNRNQEFIQLFCQS